MRVLVCRPVEFAGQTADALRNLGHEPIIAPVTRIEPIAAEIPQVIYDAVAVTSSNAIMPPPPNLAALPLYPVGAKTAKKAAHAGWTNVQPATPDAGALATAILAGAQRATRLLYLAGEPRKPELERRLAAAGIAFDTVPLYRAVPAALPDDLWRNPPEAVLHYSRASAERFFRACADQSAVVEICHCCLSADVAEAVAEAGAKRIMIASSTTEASLFAALHLCHGQTGVDVAP